MGYGTRIAFGVHLCRWGVSGCPRHYSAGHVRCCSDQQAKMRAKPTPRAARAAREEMSMAQPKQLLAILSGLLMFLVALGVRAQIVIPNPPVLLPPLPPLVSPTPIVSFAEAAALIAGQSLCDRVPCPTTPNVHTGALDQNFVTDYVINAKTSISTGIPFEGGPPFASAICQLYAIIRGRVVTIDQAVGTVPVVLVPQTIGQTLELQGALCPTTATVSDVGLVCTPGDNSPGVFIYNSVVTLLPFIAAESGIQNSSRQGEPTSALSNCTPANAGRLGQ
jgi:hypothetical protein